MYCSHIPLYIYTKTSQIKNVEIKLMPFKSPLPDYIINLEHITRKPVFHMLSTRFETIYGLVNLLSPHHSCQLERKVTSTSCL